MKKFLAMLLAVLTVCSFAACAAKPAENDTADVEIADALTLLNTVWASYTDDEKFPAAGGDYDEANMTDGAPARSAWMTHRAWNIWSASRRMSFQNSTTPRPCSI